MSIQPLIIKPADEREQINVLGVEMKLLASKEETNGWEMTVQRGKEGSGPPPHNHPWDESFYVLKGSVDIFCQNKTHSCPAGSLVNVPAGTTHSFKFGKDGGEMLEITGKGTNAITLFKSLSQACPTLPPDIPKLVTVMSDNGVSVELP